MIRLAVLLTTVLSSLPLRAAEVSGDDPMVRSVHQAIGAALSTTLEHGRSDQPVAWNDAGGGLTGSIIVFTPTLQGSRWCRWFRYTVRNAAAELTDSGLYCRDPFGLWRVANAPDLLDKRPLGTAQSQPDSILLRLQKNLVRLAYGSLIDGARDAGFTTALTRFEADEGMRQGTDPDSIRRALMLSTATLARSNAGAFADRLGRKATRSWCAAAGVDWNRVRVKPLPHL